MVFLRFTYLLILVNKIFSKTDPLYDKQHALQEMQIPKVWGMGLKGSKNVKICVIDTGIDMYHPDLQTNLWKNPNEKLNGIDDDNNGIIDDIYGASYQNGIGSNNTIDNHGHGTMVAGIIAATYNNGIGITGIVQDISIISCKFLDDKGFGTAIDAMLCINYCVEQNASIINASWGSMNKQYNIPDYTLEILEKNNIILVAAGSLNGPMYPADSAFPNIINTNMIKTPYKHIISTFPPHLYEFMSGESCGVAHITGCLGLLFGNTRIKEQMYPIIYNLTQNIESYNFYPNDTEFRLYEFISRYLEP
jgi:subtilisin family serine protease